MHAQDHAVFDAGMLDADGRGTTPAHMVMPTGNADAAIRFVDCETGAPLAWRPYRLQTGTQLVLGRTDADGCTAVLTGAQRAGLAGWALE